MTGPRVAGTPAENGLDPGHSGRHHCDAIGRSTTGPDCIVRHLFDGVWSEVLRRTLTAPTAQDHLAIPFGTL